MNVSNRIRRRKNLHPAKVLHRSDSSCVELCEMDGRFVVRKTYTARFEFKEVEADFLRHVDHSKLRFLRIPKILFENRNTLVTTYVEREQQTRDSILLRHWSSDDFARLIGAMREFQTIDVPKSCFSRKQRWMGVCYPVVRMCLDIRKLKRRGWLPPGVVRYCSAMATGYLRRRFGIQNVLTHYDLNTTNCAFCPDGAVSLVDFDLIYYLGDPLFDLCYFATIPCQAIQEWGFQRELLSRAMHSYGASWNRVRFLIVVCSLSRMHFFRRDEMRRNVYRENILSLMRGTVDASHALSRFGDRER